MAIGLPTAAFTAHVAVYGQWIEDDSGLTFAYARSLTNGAGPVLQPGAAPIEAYSDPTWLAVLAVGRLLGLFDHGTWFGVPDIVLFPKVIAVACFALMVSAIFELAAAVTSRPVLVTVAAGTITAAVPSFVIWSVSGLENALFALAVVALAGTLVRGVVQGRLLAYRTAMVCGALAGFTALTRPDGAIYGLAHPLLVLFLLQQDTRTASARAVVASLGAFAIPVGLYEICRLLVFGDWLPNTARAKSQELPGLGNLARPSDLVSYAGWLSVVLAVAAVAVVLTRRTTTRQAVAALLVPLGLALAAFAVLQPDWMPQARFATPVWPLAATVVALAAVQWWPDATLRTRILAAILAAVAGSMTLAGWVNASKQFRAQPTAPLCTVATAVGTTINTYADILGVRRGSLLAVDGGGTVLTTRLQFVDLSGLGDVTIARMRQRDEVGLLPGYVLATVRPTFIKTSEEWIPGLLADPRFARDYVAILAPANARSVGTWVRRDAVPGPTELAAVQTYARRAVTDVELPMRRIGPLQWQCAPVLRPPANAPALPGAQP